METTAALVSDRVAPVREARVDDLRELGRAIERLGTVLRSLVARDDEPPPVWRSATFARGVEAIRATLSPVASLPELAWSARGLVDAEPGANLPFGIVAHRLARDPASVALAVRWHEIDGAVRVAAWPDVVRRRSLEPVGRDPVHEAGLWFG
jgi:hypothetical protein